MLITTKMLDTGIRGNLQCTSILKSNLCYSCKVYGRKEVVAKLFYLVLKDTKNKFINNFIISFCSAKCKNRTTLSKNIFELSEKDLFYIKISKGE